MFILFPQNKTHTEITLDNQIKETKIIVLGLPKTGTSTLAVMLRMLNYKVTGPNILLKKHTNNFEEVFNRFDAFQDYPWCFVWKDYLMYENIKFIVLKRDKEAWWKSFYESYGGKGCDYLAFDYMEITKETKNKTKFLEYYDRYYDCIQENMIQNPEKFLQTDILKLNWQELCDFLGKPQPKDVFGRYIPKPHINKLNQKFKTSNKFFWLKLLKEYGIKMIGTKRWLKMIVFLRKNQIVK